MASDSLRVDLHSHSTLSDGLLEPEALVERAAGRGVALLALTDHDTTAGCAAAAAACARRGIRFVPGVELSASWRGRSVHVIGLGGEDCAALEAHNAGLRERRRRRIEEIGARLERRGRLPGAELARRVNAATAVPTRQHLARELVAAGFAPDVPRAFERFLGAGRDGHVPVEWPTLEATLALLKGAGRTLVLAHPHRYRLSSGALRGLVGEFTEQGGAALELSLPGMSPDDADRLARLARASGLAGSAGSDFHDPAVPWNPLGRSLKLAADIEPLAARFLPAASALTVPRA
jgi:predicted metal-dependent phosphoesterase TrpH